MNKKPLLHKFGRALLFAVLSISAGSALATGTFGTRLNNWCAMQPVQATAPQQSRPYQASGNSCLLCHTSANATANNLNARGTASLSCTGSGTATTCGATVNPYCVATAPSNATITAPAAGTTVTQGQSLTFTAGNPTNPDGFPLSFTWMFTGGMPNATGQSVSVPMTVAGSITSTLQVRNSVGMLATGTAPTRTVTVSGVAANQPPVATIVAPTGNVTVAQGGTVTFQGSGTDPDGNTPLTYSWNFGGGAANSTQQNPGAVTFNTAGTFTVTFTVTDSLGLSSTPVTRVVTVTGAANQPPVATIVAPTGNVTVAQGGTVTFQGSGTDPDGNTPLTYSWNFGGGAANSTQQNPGAVTFNTAGTFTVTFTVTDSLGLSSTPVTRVVTVTGAANQPPVATIVAPTGNVTVAQGGTVTFQGSGTDPDGNTPLTYSWNFGGGAANSTQQNPGAVRFNTAGTFTVTFTVTDSLGLSSTPVTRTVTVTATPPVTGAPVATIVAPTSNVTIARGGTVTFRGTGTAAGNGDDDEEDDDNGDSLRYNWNFGGGATNSTRQNPGAVRFNTAGVFTVTLTVTDSRGRVSAPVTRIITVTAPANQPPVASITAPDDNVTIVQGGTVTFSGSGTDPDGNTPLTYSWDFGGGAANSTQQNPGAVRFDTAGTFTVTFTVTDSLGLSSAPVIRTVTVTAAPRQPVATIAVPAMNVSVLPGGTVTFRAENMGASATYSWRFPGGTPSSSTRQNPGAVRFNSVGAYTVTLTVRRGGVSTMATRVVTVAPSNQSPRIGDCLNGDDEHDDEHDDDHDD